MNSNKNIARVAGVLYLIYIILTASSTFMPQNIITQEGLFRIRNAMELFSMAFFLSAAWALYVLLKPVHKNLALLFVLLNMVGVAVECICILIHYAALLPIHGDEYLKGFSHEQLQSLSMLMLNINGNEIGRAHV